MLFGVILSVICCGLILTGLIMITRNSIGRKPELLDRITYIIAPYGLAICMYYYIFFWRDVDIAAAFAGFAGMNIILDIVLNILIPAAILSFLFISFMAVRNIGWRIFTITFLAFFLLAWLNIVWLALDYSRNYSTSYKLGFPIVQWSGAVFVALLAFAVFERKRRRDHPEQQAIGEPNVESSEKPS